MRSQKIEHRIREALRENNLHTSQKRFSLVIYKLVHPAGVEPTTF
jgi:hypothetical protein